MGNLIVNRMGSVSDTRTYYLSEVDAAAERARHISPAKEAVYQRKLAEARGEMPVHLLAQEAESLNTTVDEIKKRVLTSREDWERAAFLIEKDRIKAKDVIRKTDSAQEMYEALCQCSFFGN